MTALPVRLVARSSALDVALAHAKAGRPVFPCHPGTKAPLVPRGFHAATVDEGTIRDWWRLNPRAMAGMPTGAASGVWALDMDRDPSGKDGVAEIERLGKLPPTLSAATPRGGRHAFFRYDPARPVRSQADKIAHGVDTRGEGGYVILAGSVRSDGASYEWASSPAEPIADAPEWLMSAYEDAQRVVPSPEVRTAPRQIASGGSPYADTALRSEIDRVAKSPAGRRNDALNCAAFNLGQLVASGDLGEEEVRAALLDGAEACGLVATDGVSSVRKTINSGVTAGSKTPRGDRGTTAPRIVAGTRRVGDRVIIEEEAQEVGRGPRGLFVVTRYDDIGEEHHKDWLIADFLGAGETTAVYGLPGSGKSVVVGDMAAHVAAGVPWFGRAVREGAVLYLAAERAAVVKRRLAAWRKRHGLWGLPLSVVEASFNLRNDPAQIEEIVRLAAAELETFGKPVVWIILDTKAQVLGGGDPNSDQDVGGLMANAATLSRVIGAHVTIIDHVPHGDPTRMKGSGALGGAIDGSFLVQGADGAHSIKIGSKRPNDGPDEFEEHFRIESEVIGEGQDGKVTTSAVVVRVAPQERSVVIAIGRQRAKLGPAAQRINIAFGRIFDEGRTILAPDAPGVRPGTRAVSLADLRDRAEALGLTSEPEPSDAEARNKWMAANRQAWKRGMAELSTKGVLRAEEGFVWDPTHGRSVTDTVTVSVTERDEP